MKKLLLMFSLFFLVGCKAELDTAQSKINLVKNGVLDNLKTTTVGSAFDNWDGCKVKDWSYVQSKNGIESVSFYCEHDAGVFTEQLVESVLARDNTADISFVDIAKIETFYNFRLNRDDTFFVDSINNIIVWRDYVYFEDSLDDVYQNLSEVVYSNSNPYSIRMSEYEASLAVMAVAQVRRIAEMISQNAL